MISKKLGIKIPTLLPARRQGWGPLWLIPAMIALFGIVAHGQQSSGDSVSSTAVASPSTPAQPDSVNKFVTKGELIKRVNPKYPKQARKKHIEGTVVMKATITKSGDIGNLELVSGDPLLAKAAMEAVKEWKYRPYRLMGQPVDVETQITVNFELSHH